jgi:hypothetical protein
MRYTVTSSDSLARPVVVVVDDVSPRRSAGMRAAPMVFGPESNGDEQAVARSTMATKTNVSHNRLTGPFTPTS